MASSKIATQIFNHMRHHTVYADVAQVILCHLHGVGGRPCPLHRLDLTITLIVAGEGGLLYLLLL